MVDSTKFTGGYGLPFAPAKSAILVMQHPATAHRTQHALQCGGLETTVVRTMDELDGALAKAKPDLPVVLVDRADLDAALDVAGGRLRKSKESCRLFLFVDERDDALYGRLAELPQVGGLLGLRYAGSPPRPWELLALARRCASGTPAPPKAPLSWGHTWRERIPSTPADRDKIVEEVAAFCSTLMARRLSENVAVISHELLMNAMYDAPVDDGGHALYADRRDRTIELPPIQRPVFGYGSDGRRLVISISDPFGRLKRETAFRGLHRGLTAGTVDSSHGGAGLGLVQIHEASMMVYFDVSQLVRTQVTTVIEIDVPARELRQLPRSVHFFGY